MIGDILQPTHLLFILVIALLVLGPKRLPEVGRSLGRGLRDFRNALSGDEHEPDQHEDVMAPALPAEHATVQPAHDVNAPTPVAHTPVRTGSAPAEPEHVEQVEHVEVVAPVEHSR